jgi:Fe-S oxidoreductase
MISLEEMFQAAKAEYLEKCSECGLCIESCPYLDMAAYACEAPEELNSSRLSLLGEHIFSEDVYRFARGCLLCGACEGVCPEGINPKLVNLVCRVEFAGWEGEGVAERYAGDVANIRSLLPENPASIFRVLYSLQVSPEEDARLAEMKGAEEVPEVVLFLSCYGMAQAENIFNLLDLLRLTGVRFSVLKGLDYCCGLLSILSGDVESGGSALNALREAVAARPGATLLVDCTSCYGWLRQVAEYQPLGFDFQHVTQFMAERVGSLPFQDRVQTRVTYHDPCHFGRNPDESAAPRRILEAAPNVELVEMKHTCSDTSCCGAPASSFLPDLASRIRRARIDEAIETGAEVLLSTCSGCTSFFRRGLEEGEIEVSGFNSFLARCLNLENPDRLAELAGFQTSAQCLAHTQSRLWRGVFAADEIRPVLLQLFPYSE